MGRYYLTEIERPELKKLIAKKLKIDEACVYEEANIRTLCAISLYLSDFEEEQRNEFKIKTGKLNQKIDKPHQDGRDLTFDLTEFFYVKSGEKIILEDWIGYDSFYDLGLTHDMLILQVEIELGGSIPDDVLANMPSETVENLLKFFSDDPFTYDN